MEKTINLSPELHQKLRAMKQGKETFEKVIERLLTTVEAQEQKFKKVEERASLKARLEVLERELG